MYKEKNGPGVDINCTGVERQVLPSTRERFAARFKFRCFPNFVNLAFFGSVLCSNQNCEDF